MKNRFSRVLAITGALAIAAGGALAHAEAGHSGQQDGAALLSAKVGIVQAIQAAETQSGGKASSADFGAAEGQNATAFHVEVIRPDGSEQQLTVDAETGKVTTMAASDEGDEKSGQGDAGDENEQD